MEVLVDAQRQIVDRFGGLRSHYKDFRSVRLWCLEDASDWRLATGDWRLATVGLLGFIAFVVWFC
ncbi:unnamed protein product [Acidithrix sp. C25]|nr:unnamed protein product [Acidithrix sp. C25]